MISRALVNTALVGFMLFAQAQEAPALRPIICYNVNPEARICKDFFLNRVCLIFVGTKHILCWPLILEWEPDAPTPEPDLREKS